MRAEVLLPNLIHLSNFVEYIGQIQSRGADGIAIHSSGGKQDVELPKAFSHLSGSSTCYGFRVSIRDLRDNGFEDAAVVNYGGADWKIKVGIDELHVVK